MQQEPGRWAVHMVSSEVYINVKQQQAVAGAVAIHAVATVKLVWGRSMQL